MHGDAEDEPPIAARVRAIEAILTEKGLVDRAALDTLIETYESRVGPRNGARVVARAWTDPAYRDWLRQDATAAIASLGYAGRQGEHMRVVENGPRLHNLVVCTLCSCYPRMLLGIPPEWYKSAEYRSRVVREPRKVLSEFGLTLPAEVTIRVHDSSADMRYLVLPMRPPGTESLSEDALAELVTPGSVVGTGIPG